MRFGGSSVEGEVHARQDYRDSCDETIGGLAVGVIGLIAATRCSSKRASRCPSASFGSDRPRLKRQDDQWFVAISATLAFIED